MYESFCRSRLNLPERNLDLLHEKATRAGMTALARRLVSVHESNIQNARVLYPEFDEESSKMYTSGTERISLTKLAKFNPVQLIIHDHVLSLIEDAVSLNIFSSIQIAEYQRGDDEEHEYLVLGTVYDFHMEKHVFRIARFGSLSLKPWLALELDYNRDKRPELSYGSDMRRRRSVFLDVCIATKLFLDRSLPTIFNMIIMTLGLCITYGLVVMSMTAMSDFFVVSSDVEEALLEQIKTHPFFNGSP